jgi:hypothetical protein
MSLFSWIKIHLAQLIKTIIFIKNTIGTTILIRAKLMRMALVKFSLEID